MLWDKTHDPRKNAELLSQLADHQVPLVTAIQETEALFQKYHIQKSPLKQKKRKPSTFSERIFRLLSEPYRVLKPTKIDLDSEGNVIPNWKPMLDQEYENLLNTMTHEVNIVDFGAVGDGKTDCTAAFKQAIGNGGVKVVIPKGVFITKGIRLPSWTYLIGAGKGVTTIKLHDHAPKGTRLLTNANHWKGNHHVFVQGMSLNWNVERLGNVTKTSTWGNHSSCLTYAKVTYGWVKDVEAMNPGLHCFDITSTLYNYAGDGYRARGGSKYIWLDNLTGYGFGDDGITTHHSDFIFISRAHMCDPSGLAHRKGFSNSNGFEVDDGSRNVLLVHTSSARCFGGVESKAHQNSSAASNVEIVGHISVNDNRSFNFRHIGHHKSGEEESSSAFNIKATMLVSIAPKFSDLYVGSTPRGMVISAYKNVVVHYFTLIGDPEYDYLGNPVIAIQYRARNVALEQISLSNFKKTGPPIKIFGSENRADTVRINHVTLQNHSSKEIVIGADIQEITVKNVIAMNHR